MGRARSCASGRWSEPSCWTRASLARGRLRRRRPCWNGWTPNGCAAWTSISWPTGDPTASRPGHGRRRVAGLAVALTPSAGLRNVLVHGYVDLDVARLVAAVPLATEQYGEYVRQVAR